MISKKSLVITAISIIGAIILAIWLYITFHILFIFLFIPLAFVGPLFGGISRKRNFGRWDNFYTDMQEGKNEKKPLLPEEFPQKTLSPPENTENENDDKKKN